MSTKTRFEKEAKGNSEMVYYSALKYCCRHFSEILAVQFEWHRSSKRGISLHFKISTDITRIFVGKQERNGVYSGYLRINKGERF